MTAEEIKVIDFDLKIDNDTYVQTSIMNVSQRYKIFYCFKNGDTREDGEDRCSQETFLSIGQQIIDSLNEVEAAPTNITYYIKISSHSNSVMLYNNRDASPEAIKEIIEALTSHIDELSFLNAFKRFV